MQARKRNLFSSEFNEVGLVTPEGIKGEFSVTGLRLLRRELKCPGHWLSGDGLGSEPHQEEHGRVSSCSSRLWELWEEFPDRQSAAVTDALGPPGRWTPEAGGVRTVQENLELRARSPPESGPEPPTGEGFRRTSSPPLRR